MPSFVEHARATYPGVRFDLESIEAIAEPDGALGGVLSWFSTIHHEPSRIAAPLAEFARVLRPGGLLVLGYFDGAAVEPFDHAVAPAYRWPAEELERLLAEAGFEVLETHRRTSREHRPVGAILCRLVAGVGRGTARRRYRGRMPNERLARAFESTGEDYDRYRPGFPLEAAEVIAPARVPVALDLGAGTGKFAERLQDRADRVLAVDPSERMLAVLRAKLPSVETHVGTAEHIPVPDGSVSLVTVAQAFHWFDRERACREILRVLVPGGTLGLLWNGPDPTCTWDQACYRIAHPSLRDSSLAPPTSEESLPGFATPAHTSISWTERVTRTAYLARWQTVSTFLAAEPAERDAMTARVARTLDSDPDTAGRERFELPHVTDVYVYQAL